MKYYLLSWTTRDGDNEYGEEVIVKLAKPLNPLTVFRKVLKDFYFAEHGLEKVDEAGYCYEVRPDYRIHEYEAMDEITQAQAKVLLETRAIGVDYKF